MGVVLAWPRHLRERCRRASCLDCMSGSCIVEVLFVCAVCGGAEGDLPTDCPGEVIPHELRREIHAGRANFISQHGWITTEDWRFRSNV